MVLPTYKGVDWETATDFKEQQTFEFRDKNLNVAGNSQGWNSTCEMCVELQPILTKEDFFQLRSELNWTRANTASHGYPTGIHCALLHSPVIALLLSHLDLHVDGGVRYTTLSNGEKNK